MSPRTTIGDLPRTTIDDLLAAARERLVRLRPEEALDAVGRGAVLIDIRSEVHRARDGVVPGSFHCPRNVLEWRLDPASGHADPALGSGFDRHILLLCDEGYQSSLAAATLQDLGFVRATDVIGGFKEWRAAGLPVEWRRDDQPPASSQTTAARTAAMSTACS